MIPREKGKCKIPTEYCTKRQLCQKPWQLGCQMRAASSCLDSCCMFIHAVCLDLGFEEQIWFVDVEEEGRGEEMALVWVHTVLSLQNSLPQEQQPGANLCQKHHLCCFPSRPSSSPAQVTSMEQHVRAQVTLETSPGTGVWGSAHISEHLKQARRTAPRTQGDGNDCLSNTWMAGP